MCQVVWHLRYRRLTPRVCFCFQLVLSFSLGHDATNKPTVALLSTFLTLATSPEAEKAIKLFEKDLEMKVQAAAAKTQGQNERKAVSQVCRIISHYLTQANPTQTAAPSGAERILGMRKEAAGGLSFLVKWKGSDEMDFVGAKEAKAKIPQVTRVLPPAMAASSALYAPSCRW